MLVAPWLLLAGGERIQGGIGFLLTDVGQGIGTVPVLPAPRGLSSDRSAVLLLLMVWLIWESIT